MISSGPPTVGGLEQAQIFNVGVVTILFESMTGLLAIFEVVNK